MAFVSTPVDARTFVRGTRLRASATCSTRAGLRMGYGDYSYLTDKTQGHLNNYYIDKARIAADFVRAPPRTDADAVLGRTAKGALAVPKEGVPQIADGVLARDPSSPPDPRIAESDGSLYEWDAAYKDPKFAPETYADISDDAVADDNFLKFRDASARERGAMLTAQDLGSTLKNKLRLEYGYSESFLLTLEGQHDRMHALTEKIMEVPFLTPYGRPQSEIPGTPYLGAVNALDFQKKSQAEIAFWKADQPQAPALYQKPKGADKAELPYNAAPKGIEQLKQDQAAAGLIAGN